MQGFIWMSVKQKTFWSTAFVSAIISIGGMCSGAMVARMLGPGDRGLLASITLWQPLIASICILGLHEAGNYYIASSTSVLRRREISTATCHIAFGLSFFSVLIAGPFLVFALGLPESIAPLAYFYLLYIPLFIVSSALLGLDQGQHFFKKYNVVRATAALVYVLFISVLFLSGNGSLVFIVSSLLLAASIPAFCRLYSYRSVVFVKPKLGMMLILIRRGGRFHFASVMNMLSAQIDKIFVVMFLSHHDAGLYVVAQVIPYSCMTLIGSTFQTLVFPMARRIDGARKQLDFILENIQAAWLLLLLAASMLFIVLHWAIPFIFGADYFLAVGTAGVLSFVYAVNAIKGISVRSIRALGDGRTGFIAELVYLVIFSFCIACAWWYGEQSILAVAVIGLVSNCAAYLSFILIASKTYEVSIVSFFDVRLGFSKAHSLFFDK